MDHIMTFVANNFIQYNQIFEKKMTQLFKG